MNAITAIDRALIRAGSKRKLAYELSNTEHAKNKDLIFDHVQVGRWINRQNVPNTNSLIALSEYLGEGVGAIMDSFEIQSERAR